jgi:nicotinamidase-related amidase
MSLALLIIDIQNDYFPGGSMELVGSPEAGRKAGELLAAFRKRQLPIIHIRHVSTRPGAAFLLEGTWGAEINPCVAPEEREPVFTKNYPNSFRDTGLLSWLQEHKVTSLVIAGMMTHMCVDTTVRAAFDLGFTCTLVHDACATRNLVFGGQTVTAEQVQTAYVAALGALFAKASTVEEIVATI